mgnify:CR=1 FL=1
MDNNLLIFTREDMLEENVIRCRSAKTFEERFLRKGFKDQISVIRILDSRREAFVFTKKKERKYMNKQESDVLNVLLLEPFINQRILAEVSGHSLGVVNRSIKELIKADYLDESIRPTAKAQNSNRKLRNELLFLPLALACEWFPLIRKCRKAS